MTFRFISTADQLKTRLAAAADRGCSRVTTSRTPRAVVRLKPSLVPVSLHDGSNWQLTSLCSISVGQFVAPTPSEMRPSVSPRSRVRSSGGAAAQTAARYQQRLCTASVSRCMSDPHLMTENHKEDGVSSLSDCEVRNWNQQRPQ